MVRSKCHRRSFAVLVSLALVLAGPAAGAAPDVSLSASGENGESIHPEAPSGQPCDEADAIEFQASDDLAAGMFSALPGFLGLSLEVLHDGGSAAHLVSGSVSLANERGSMRLRLTGGSCEAPAMSFFANELSGSGTWTIDPATTAGSYREATGSGTFQLEALLNPGPGNPWSLDLTGPMSVLQPTLSVSVAESSWAHGPGAGRGRTATVVYRVANDGPGDSFHGAFLEPDAPDGFDLLTIEPTSLGDIPVGEFVDVTVRWSVAQLKGREFDTTVHLDAADALDRLLETHQPVHVVVPSRG